MDVRFKFNIGNAVRIDGCPETRAVVIQAKVSQNDSISYAVEWMSGGMYSATVEEWRVSRA